MAGANVMPLTQKQVNSYFRDGFVVPDWRMPQAALERLRRAYQNIVDDNPGKTYLTTLHRKDGGLQALNIRDDWVDLVTLTDLLDMLEQLMGPDICLWDQILFDKPPRQKQKIGWHQDGLYWPIRPVQTTAVWMSLDGSTREKGCLKVVRGSHRNRAFYAHVDCTGDDTEAFEVVIPDSIFDPNDVVDIVLEAGQISIHDGMIIHGSAPNSSGEPRVGLVSRFMATTSLFDHDAGEAVDAQYLPYFPHAPGRRYWADTPLYLVRGADACGKNDFSAGHFDSP
jgi:hypothetical protein